MNGWLVIQIMSKKTNYQEISLWQTRYKQNVCQWYEWLATPNQIISLIQKYLLQPSKILQLGCGSSNLAQKLMTLHHYSVTCLDFSKEIIKHKNKNAKEGVSYKVHDITQTMPFEDESFDVVIEKNTIDCLFCYEDYPVRVMRLMKDCYRVLKEGGVMLSISHGKEKSRRFFYRNRFSPFYLEVIPVQDLKAGQTQVFLYVLTKGQAAGRNEIEATGEIKEDPQEEELQNEDKEYANEDEKQQNDGEEASVPKQEENNAEGPDEEEAKEEKAEEDKQAEQQYEFDELDEAEA